MNKKKIIEEVKRYVKKELAKDNTGHDWYHSWRVWKMAKEIAKKEEGDFFVIELAALLHDIADYKFYGGTTALGSLKIKKLLRRLKVDKKIINHVCHIFENISFKGAKVKNKIKTKEGKIVQDADWLDVAGAIGIARVFTFGGSVERNIYDSKIKPRLHKSFKDYKKYKDSTSINHFYEKVLLLKDRLNTKTAEKIAKDRFDFLDKFLKQFFKEWNAKL